MTELITLTLGEPYPLPLEQGQNAVAQFLAKTGNVLQILMPGMSSKELTALRSGMIKSGFLYEGGALLLLFQFYGSNGRITFDAPFDIRRLSKDRRTLPNLKNPHQRLAIEIRCIDEKKILRALRLVTMPPAMTLKFLSAVQDQLDAIDKPGVMAGWLQQQPEDLLNQTENWVLGK